jgi:NADP-dependent 3-hydroxy acid dehydrogenase YdfG
VAVIDTLDDATVSHFMDEVAKEIGRIDVLLDAAGPRAKEYGKRKERAGLAD